MTDPILLPTAPRPEGASSLTQGGGEEESLLPPVLTGHATPELSERVESFYGALAELFEGWVHRRESPHTRRAYRRDVLHLVEELGIVWPNEAVKLLGVTVGDVRRWRDGMVAAGRAPKTVSRRVSSVSSFYGFLAAAAAELRLPITVPNPAHAQFVARGAADPVRETRALSATRARQLMGLPEGEDLIAKRDRAILKTYLYTGARLATVCRLEVGDFHQDEEQATLRLTEKGGRRRTAGLHFQAAQAVGEYLEALGEHEGALFRPRRGPTSQALADRAISPQSMGELVSGYLARLPGAQEGERGRFTTHSLRATTATLLLDAGTDIVKVQELLGHKHVTTTQIYDKRRRGTKESASHDVPV